MKYLLISGLIFLILFSSGCNNDDKVFNKMVCQEKCLSMNSSFDSLKSVNSSIVSCSCVSYVGVSYG